jgi:Protein of unknown function (DUF3137)
MLPPPARREWPFPRRTPMEQQPLETLYHERLRPALTAFTARAEQRVSRLGRIGVLLAPIGILASYLLYQQYPESNLVFIPAGLVFGYLLASYLRVRRSYRDLFKREVIAPVIEAIHPAFGYSPEGAISRGEFIASTLFGGGADAFRGEDLVTAKVSGATLRFSEVEAHGGGAGRRDTLFRGFFIVVDLPWSFRATTTVLPDESEPLLGHIAPTLKAVGAPPGELVHVDHAEFERLYRVHSAEPAEARALLSPAMVDRILRFRRHTGQTLCLAFVGNRLYAAIPSWRDRFEPPELVSIRNVDSLPRVGRMLRDNLQSYIDDLMFGMDLVQEMTLHRQRQA